MKVKISTPERWLKHIHPKPQSDDWRSGQDEDMDDYDPVRYNERDSDDARAHNYKVEETV